MNRARIISLWLLAGCVAGVPACQKIKDKLDKAMKETESGEPAKPAEPDAVPAVAPAPAPSGQAEIRQLSAGDYAAFIAQPDRLVVVDFYADWCAPCRILGPILERVVAEQGSRAALGKLNVDRAGDVGAKEGVRSIPDVRIFLNGRMIDQFVGAIPEAEVRARISRHVAQVPQPKTPAPAEPVATPAAPIAPMDKDWLPPGLERRGKGQK